MHVLAYLGVSDLKSVGLISFYVEDPVKSKALTHVPFEERSTMMIPPLEFLSISQWRSPMTQPS